MSERSGANRRSSTAGACIAMGVLSLSALVGIFNDWLRDASLDEQIQGKDVGGSFGGVLLLAACATAVLALWRLSPAWRPARAGWLGVVIAGCATVLTAWVIVDADRFVTDAWRSSAGGTTVTPWAWVTAISFLAVGCVAAVLTTAEDRGTEPNRSDTTETTDGG